LSGRIDRIDRNPTTGAWVVFDYKTGETGGDPSSALTRSGEWRDLQLPLYRCLLQDLRTADGSIAEVPEAGEKLDLGYLSIPKDPGLITPKIAEWTPDELARAEETARDVIRRLRQSGGIWFDPLRSGRKVRGELATLTGHGLLQVDGEEKG
jgi:RecB family exonuclease